MPDEAKSSGGIVEQAVSWLRGQEFNNVLLALILGSVGYGSYLVFTYAIPAHLKEIQNGYQQQAETLKVAAEKQADAFDKAQDRDHELIRGLLKNHGIDVPSSTRNVVGESK